MTKIEPIEFSGEMQQLYWEGKTNALVRYWVYLRGGLSVFNEFKNYLLLLFGSYWTIKTVDWWVRTGISDAWLVILLTGGAIVGVGLLLFVGHWQLYKATKSQDYMSAKIASITGYNSYNMQIRQTEALEEIRDSLKNIKNNTV